MKQRILFVDDDGNVLEGLRRMLRNMRHEWDMAFAESGERALEILRESTFDVVVSDMRMPGMDGSQLLARVQELYPNAARIILSGHSDRDLILKSVRSAHQFLAKPCDSRTLQTTIARALALRNLLGNTALIGLVSRIETLPSAPAIYREMIEELNSPGASIPKVAGIIAKDVGMTAKILQLANSAFFGLYQHVNNMERALTLLGIDTVVALVLTVHIFTPPSGSLAPGFSITALWNHSMATAFAAKAIAREEKLDRADMEDAFMGGLIHDVGKLVLAASLAESYGEVITRVRELDCPLWIAEQEVLGTTHAAVGAYLMGVWGIPDRIVEAIAFHHSPMTCPDRAFSPLTAVHVGNALAQAEQSGGKAKTSETLDMNYLAWLGLAERLALWSSAGRNALQQAKG
jgi:putative nucleotidyltransferase with HDIG domain